MGKEVIQMVMNRPGIDNRQFALNVMHWPSGLLPLKMNVKKQGVGTSK